jgi:hypothetical protein
MKNRISLLIILLPLIGCNERKQQCKIVIYPEKEIVTFELKDAVLEDIFLVNSAVFSIYKLSEGIYSDWNNDYFISMITSGVANDFQTPDEFNLSPLRKNTYDSLVERYTKNFDVLDSVSFKSNVDFLKRRLSSMVFIEKGEKLLGSFSLFPLIEHKGAFKIVCSYKPDNGVSSDFFDFRYPAKIDGYKRMDNKMVSDTLYITY